MATRRGAGRRLLLALFAAVSFGLVGCGGGDDATATAVPAAAGDSAPTAGDGSVISSLSASPLPTTEPTTGQPADPRPPDSGRVRSGACEGRIAAVAVDEVNVPPGATCTLDGTKVNGNVSVGRGATLIARGVFVDGDIEAESASSVEVTGRSNIGGNIQLQQGGSSTVRDSRIDGDLEWEEQHGRVTAEGNTIGGNLQADGNVGGVSVSGNRINGDLECGENNPRPTGGGNAVSGDTEDQCARI